MIVNETRKLVPYRQALLWELDDAGVANIVAGSGASEIESHAPYIVWANLLLKTQSVADLRKPRMLLAADAGDEVARDWAEFCAEHVLLVPLISPRGDVVAGMLLAADGAWEEGHLVLLERLADTYAHAWSALRGGRQKINIRALLTRRRKQIAFAMAVVLLFPVRQSVVAPASVAPRHPVVVAASMGAVVKEIYVMPNQEVKAGQPLFAFDNTDVNGRLEVARKSLDVARADLIKNMQMAYSCDECRSRVPVLKAEMDQKEVELQYALSMQERSLVRAEVEGTAIFRDRNDLLGKPVSVGERIMLLAQPDDSWLQVQLPVQDAITLSKGSDIRFFLNTDPLSAFSATLVQTSYEAEQTSHDVLAYTLMADFSGGKRPRLGLRGTARLYGDWVPFSYYVMRRPISWVRQHMGW
ncbi:MAG: biotin/lipoyl-binding protein [Pedobacter sp.]|nr:biotin/lipoyl-binding protein [Pedobacter sp.]